MINEQSHPYPLVSAVGNEAPGGAFGIGCEGRLCIVAESTGMRSRSAGSAGFAVRTLLDCVSAVPNEVDGAVELLRRAFDFANRALLGESNPGFAAPPDAVSALALAVVGAQAVVGHVGNARCYRARADDIVRLTRDHSALAELSEATAAPEADAFNVHNRNLLTRGLGMGDRVELEIDVRSSRPGDRFLLCSSAVWCELRDVTLGDILRAPTADAAARELRKYARVSGGSVVTVFL